MRFAIKTRPEHPTWAQIRDVWEAADEVELFESAWNWDHFYPLTEPYDGPNFEAWTMIAALAQATRRIRLGCQVTGMVYRHPAVLANMAATMDIISGGRLELGLGAGLEPDGVRRLRDRTAAAARAVRPVRRGRGGDRRAAQPGDQHAERPVRPAHRARCEPKPVQRPHPPITIGGRGRTRTLRTAARWAQQWNVITPDPQDWLDLKETLVSTAPAIGRDPGEITCSVNIRVEGADGIKQAAELAAAYRDAGADLAIMNLPLRRRPGHARPAGRGARATWRLTGRGAAGPGSRLAEDQQELQHAVSGW